MQHTSEGSVIIIGSGAGGLAAALCLAKAGKKVTVLEQHYVPGGWCHSFFLSGQRFSPGVHYMGSLDEGQSTSDLYKGLGIANDLVFFRMNPKAYEHCRIGDVRVDLPAGADAMRKHLTAVFPHEARGIAKYLNIVRLVSSQLQKMTDLKGFWDHLTIPFRTAQLGKYALFSLKRVIGWQIKDPLVKNVLNIQCGDHGLPPSKASFPLHCAVMGHYLEGGYYPMGGGASIVKAMTNAIKAHAGEVRTAQKVQKILLEKNGKNNKATGVVLDDGTVLKADIIISNADPAKTFDLVGMQNISSKLQSKLSKTKYSVTSLMLFVTVDMDVQQAGIDSGNIWLQNDQSLDEIFEEMNEEEILLKDEFPSLFISCTTLKDPANFNGHYHNFEIVTFVGHRSFQTFTDGKQFDPAKYEQIKERITEKMLKGFERVLPGVRNHIVQVSLGTPVTNQHYLNGTRGNVYGTEKTFKQTGPFGFSAKTEIDNLYLCGASTLSHGVAGATFSGVAAAAIILGCKAADLIQPAHDQHLRIYDAEVPESWPEFVVQKRSQKERLFKPVPDTNALAEEEPTTIAVSMERTIS